MSKDTPPSRPTRSDLISFAQDVISILRGKEDWGSDELGQIANAAADNGINLNPPTDES